MLILYCAMFSYIKLFLKPSSSKHTHTPSENSHENSTQNVKSKQKINKNECIWSVLSLSGGIIMIRYKHIVKQSKMFPMIITMVGFNY